MGKNRLPNITFGCSGASKAKAIETLTKSTACGYIKRDACLTVVNGLNRQVETLKSSLKVQCDRVVELQGFVEMAKTIIREKDQEIESLQEQRDAKVGDAEKIRQMQTKIEELEAERGLYTAGM